MADVILEHAVAIADHASPMTHAAKGYCLMDAIARIPLEHRYGLRLSTALSVALTTGLGRNPSPTKRSLGQAVPLKQLADFRVGRGAGQNAGRADQPQGVPLLAIEVRVHA